MQRPAWMCSLERLFIHQEPNWRSHVKRNSIAALVLLISVFADVIFFNASLSLANLHNVTVEPRPEKVQLFPDLRSRRADRGYFDSGGAAYQSEPSAQFVKRALWAHQSLYWNPYSATGSFGPETLIDIKTSPLSIVTALLGGSDLSFHLVFLAFQYAGVFCLLMLLTFELRLSLLAGIAGGVAYLLNGFNVANLASNVSQTWLYFPILLLALVSFSKRPSTLSFVGIVAGAVLILSTTFLPTTLVVCGTTMFIGGMSALAISVSTTPDWRSATSSTIRVLSGQLLAVALAGAVLAVVYLPIFEAMHYMKTADYYGARQFHPATLFNLISLFTPKHAFDAYNDITQRAAELRGNVAFHQGIVGALVATQAFRLWPTFQRILVFGITTLLALLLARVYGVPGIATVFELFPIIRNIGQQYVWAGIAILFTILIPFGVQAIVQYGIRFSIMAFTATTIVGALAYTTAIHGMGPVGLLQVIFCISFVAATALLLLLSTGGYLRIVPWLLVVILSWVELTSYVNHSRFSRTERFSDPPRFVRFLQEQGGLHRVASYGNSGIPPEYGSAYGIYEIGSMNYLILPYYEKLFNRLILPNPHHRWAPFVTLVSAPDTQELNLGALDLVGAKYLLVPHRFHLLRAHALRSKWAEIYEDPNFVVLENSNALPRAFVVHQLVESGRTPIDEGQPPRVVATSDDARLVETARMLGIGPAKTASGSDAGAAVVSRYDHARVEIQADLTAPGVLVLTDAWHPNWSARVDGQPALLGRVNEAFRGVPLASGKHIVEMTYAPRTLVLGKALSVLGLLLVGAILLLRRRLDPIMVRCFAVAADQP